MKYFREEYEEHIRDKKCRAGVCKALITYNIDNEKCMNCNACIKSCPTEAVIEPEDKMLKVVQEKCNKCGMCYEACNFDSVEVKYWLLKNEAFRVYSKWLWFNEDIDAKKEMKEFENFLKKEYKLYY